MARWGKVLVAAGIVAAAGLGWAVTAGLFTYHQATKLDRSNPKVVADEYLTALLNRDDEVGADLYSCADPAGLAPIEALRDELAGQEREHEVQIQVSWGAYQGSGERFATELTITGTKDGVVVGERKETWQFTLVEEDGWRVCGSEHIRTPSQSPAP